MYWSSYSRSNKPWISPLWTTSTFLVVPKNPFRLWHWERVGNEHQTVHLTPGNRSARGADWSQPPISGRSTSGEGEKGCERGENRQFIRGTRHERSSPPKLTAQRRVRARGKDPNPKTHPFLLIWHVELPASAIAREDYEQYTRSVPPVLESQDPQVD